MIKFKTMFVVVVLGIPIPVSAQEPLNRSIAPYIGDTSEVIENKCHLSDGTVVLGSGDIDANWLHCTQGIKSLFSVHFTRNRADHVIRYVEGADLAAYHRLFSARWGPPSVATLVGTVYSWRVSQYIVLDLEGYDGGCKLTLMSLR